MGRTNLVEVEFHIDINSLDTRKLKDSKKVRCMCYSQCPFQQGYTGECNNPSKYRNDPGAWCFEEDQDEEEDDYI